MFRASHCQLEMNVLPSTRSGSKNGAEGRSIGQWIQYSVYIIRTGYGGTRSLDSRFEQLYLNTHTPTVCNYFALLPPGPSFPPSPRASPGPSFPPGPAFPPGPSSHRIRFTVSSWLLLSHYGVVVDHLTLRICRPRRPASRMSSWPGSVSWMPHRALALSRLRRFRVLPTLWR